MVAAISGGITKPPAPAIPFGADGARNPFPIIPRPKMQTTVPMP